MLKDLGCQRSLPFRKKFRQIETQTFPFFQFYFIYHEVRTHWEPLTIFYFPHAEFRGHVIVGSLVSYTPSHINHLKLNYSNDSLFCFFPLSEFRRFKFRTHRALCVGKHERWNSCLAREKSILQGRQIAFRQHRFLTPFTYISVTCAFCTINLSNIYCTERRMLRILFLIVMFFA